MTFKPMTLRDELLEQSHIRSQLKLRWNSEYGCWEVYTTIHGQENFRWFKISEGTADWYRKNFKIEPELTSGINADGSITEFV